MLELTSVYTIANLSRFRRTKQLPTVMELKVAVADAATASSAEFTDPFNQKSMVRYAQTVVHSVNLTGYLVQPLLL